MTTIASHELQPAGMESSPDNESLYRFRKGSYVLYITLAANCRLLPDPSDYGFPPAVRKLLPPTVNTAYNQASIASFGKVIFSRHELKGITTLWHSNSIDITTLPVVREIKANVFKVRYNGEWAIAKFARFEFEIQFIEAETTAYHSIAGNDIAPKFLGHLYENGRGVGMLLEYIDGRRPAKEDFETCTCCLDQLHRLGMVHGDVNRDNFIVRAGKAKLVDFENCRSGTEEEMRKEVEDLREEFIQDSRRGAPRNSEDYKEGTYPIGI
jgi:predicted Ser/Thr protein kinase